MMGRYTLTSDLLQPGQLFDSRHLSNVSRSGMGPGGSDSEAGATLSGDTSHANSDHLRSLQQVRFAPSERYETSSTAVPSTYYPPTETASDRDSLPQLDPGRYVR